MPFAISCIRVDEAPQGSLLVASRTCDRVSQCPMPRPQPDMPWTPSRYSSSPLDALLALEAPGLPMAHAPFWAFRNPALRSYKVRFETVFFKSFKSMLADQAQTPGAEGRESECRPRPRMRGAVMRVLGRDGDTRRDGQLDFRAAERRQLPD